MRQYKNNGSSFGSSSGSSSGPGSKARVPDLRPWFQSSGSGPQALVPKLGFRTSGPGSDSQVSVAPLTHLHDAIEVEAHGQLGHVAHEIVQPVVQARQDRDWLLGVP